MSPDIVAIFDIIREAPSLPAGETSYPSQPKADDLTMGIHKDKSLFEFACSSATRLAPRTPPYSDPTYNPGPAPNTRLPQQGRHHYRSRFHFLRLLMSLNAPQVTNIVSDSAVVVFQCDDNGSV